MRRLLRYLLGVFFVGAGINHLASASLYMRIMPDYPPLSKRFDNGKWRRRDLLGRFGLEFSNEEVGRYRIDSPPSRCVPR